MRETDPQANPYPEGTLAHDIWNIDREFHGLTETIVTSILHDLGRLWNWITNRRRTMTPYRERRLAGEYDAPTSKKTTTSAETTTTTETTKPKNGRRKKKT